MVKGFFLLWGAIVLLVTGCATRPATPPTRSGPQPCDTCIEGVSNFSKISPMLWRGAQPTEEGFRNLEAAGVKTIISLREYHDDLPLLEGTKLMYLRIPMDAWDPEEAELVLFLTELERILKDPDSAPVFVHCAEGKDRTGYSTPPTGCSSRTGPPMMRSMRCSTFASTPSGFATPVFLRTWILNGFGS